MSSGNKNNNYNAVDIEQYLAGKLSPLQMHTMEKAALDDPFLAEALEGYKSMKGKEWNSQLDAIREQLSEKGKVAKIIPFNKTKTNRWKAAAAVLLIGTAAVLTFILTNDKSQTVNSKPEIAQTITAVKDSAKDFENVASTSVSASINPATAENKDGKNKLTGPKITPALSGKVTDDNAVQQRSDRLLAAEHQTANAAAKKENNNIESDNRKLSEETIKEINITLSKTKNIVDEKSFQQNQASASLKKEKNLNNYFTAQVVKADNSPMAFTIITVKKDNFGTFADVNGMIRLVSTDSFLLVDVKSVGYIPKTFMLHNNQPQTKIILQENEFVKKDTQIARNKDFDINNKLNRPKLLANATVNVEPTDGWDNYNTYVANYLEIQKINLNKEFQSEVELSFDVNSTGAISNIRIKNSPGSIYSEALKLLLLEGPKWKVKKGKSSSATVKVLF